MKELTKFVVFQPKNDQQNHNDPVSARLRLWMGVSCCPLQTSILSSEPWVGYTISCLPSSASHTLITSPDVHASLTVRNETRHNKIYGCWRAAPFLSIQWRRHLIGTAFLTYHSLFGPWSAFLGGSNIKGRLSCVWSLAFPGYVGGPTKHLSF